MNIGSVSKHSAYIAAPARQPEAGEIGKAGGDNDGDADDSKRAAPAPTLNLNGQLTGQTISVKA